MQRPWGHDVPGMLRRPTQLKQSQRHQISSLDLRLFCRPQGLGPLSHLRQTSMALVSFFCSFASWLIYIYWAHGMFRSRNDGKSQALFVPLRSLVSVGRGSVKQVTSRVTGTEFRPSLECNKFRICLWVRTGFFGQVSMEARPEGDLLGLLSCGGDTFRLV